MFKRISLGYYRTKDMPWIRANKNNIYTWLSLYGHEKDITIWIYKQRGELFFSKCRTWKDVPEYNELVKQLNLFFLKKEK